MPIRPSLLRLCFWFSSLSLSVADPLAMPQVERAVLNEYPPLLIARIERDIASGKLQESWGKFDPKLSAFADFGLNGFYDGNLFGVKLAARDPNGRTRYYTGYKYSNGDLASYDKGRTSAGGQLVLGVEVPLLRDGQIDADRLKRDIAALNLQGVGPLIEYQRIELIAKARKAYINWLSAGMELKYTKSLLELASVRNDAITRMVDEGEKAEAVKIDNQRLIAKRRLELSKAQEKLQASAIELSLFYRDAQGKPILPSEADLPQDFPEVRLYLGPGHGEPELVQAAMRQRPELRVNSIELRQIALEKRGAENAFQPELNLNVEGAVQAGAAREKDRSEDELRAGLEFSMPLGRNEARGMIQAATAKENQLLAKRRYLTDEIKARVQRAMNDHSRANEQLGLAREYLKLSEQILEFENKRFSAGESDLLELQLREQSLFESELDLVAAKSLLVKSWIELEAAQGLPAARPVIEK